MAYISKKTTVNGIKPIGSNLYGTCSTASDTAQKAVTMADFDVLVSGVTVHVQFTHKNTATNPTLKVGSTSAVPIMCNGATEGNWEDGAVISFTYNGSNWIQNDASESVVTYTLSASGDTVTLTGSDGSTSSASIADNDTKYGISINGNKLNLVEGGSGTQVTLPDNNTTYTLTLSGHTLTLTPSSGTAQTITLPDNNTTYTLTISGHTLTLTPSSGTAQSVTLPDNNTKYGLSISGHTVSLVEGGSTASVTVPDNNTTYGLSISGHTVSLVAGGSTTSVTVPDNNTWNANSKTVAGYVSAPTASGTYRYWGTNASGDPSWMQHTLSLAESYVAISSTSIDTYTNGSQLTLNRGLYILNGIWAFGGFTSSGQTTCEVQLYNATTGNILSRCRRTEPSSNFRVQETTHLYQVATDSTVIRLRGSSTRAYTKGSSGWGNGFNKIYAMRIG